MFFKQLFFAVLLMTLLSPAALAAVGGISSSNSPGAVIIGYTSTTCTSGIAGALRYNSATSVWNYCNGTAWMPISSANCPIGPLYSRDTGEGSCCGINSPIWGDGTYIYVGQVGAGSSNVLFAYTFDETAHTWTRKSGITTYTAGDANWITGDGAGTVFVAEGTSGLQAYSFNGTTFTLKGSYSTTMDAQALWYQGGYLFVADNANGIKAFSFNGTTFTLLATNKPTSTAMTQVWGDGTTIYAGDNGAGKLRAYTFNGTAFTAGGTKSYSEIDSIGGDGTYIYIGSFKTLYALTYAASAFTQKASANVYEYALPMVVKNGYIYIGTYAIRAFTFDGTSFTLKGNQVIDSPPGSQYFATSNFIYGTAKNGYDSPPPSLSAIPACH